MLNHIKGVLANILWGLVVAYYFFVRSVDVDRMLIYRVVFTFLLLTSFGLWYNKTFSGKLLKQAVIPALLITVNGYVYLVAIANGHAMEAAYAYLITPILTILCVRVFLGGSHTILQWAGIAVCFAVIVFYAVMTRTLPWYGLGIALPFALYITWHRYCNTQSSLDALRHEYLLLLVLPILYVAFNWHESTAIIAGEMTSPIGVLISLSGIVTVAPLALFIAASTTLPSIYIGLYQFVGPIISMLIAATLFGEHITNEKLVLAGGLIIGMALAVVPFSKFTKKVHK